MSWYAVDVTLAARAREAVEYALMEAGASGTESALRPAGTVIEAGGERKAEARFVEDECVRIAAYFDSPPDVARVRAALVEALHIYQLAPSDVRELTTREVAERDWLAEWKRNWQPVEAGARFIIAPPWSKVDAPNGRILIRIEPGMAFGTGTHETTRLCLGAIEEHYAGESFLDVGTGTGILAIAAAKLFPESAVEACDTDPLAITVAHENARLNGVAERINFRVGTLGDAAAGASASLVCANLTADVILPLLPALVAAAPKRLILSGILETQADPLRARLGELGIDRCDITQAGEWVAMLIRRDVEAG